MKRNFYRNILDAIMMTLSRQFGDRIETIYLT
jgi:hypothetical protein